MKRLAAKFIALMLLAASVAASLSGCAKKEVLTIYTWEGMFPQELLDGFTADTGIEINYVNFDMNETMLAKLEAAKGGDYDFVIADDYIVEQAIEKGLAAEIDKSRIATWDNINPIYQGQYYDPEDKYTVPCGAGIMELIYRPSAVDFEITGYEDLWDESLEDRVGIIANPRVVNGMVLKLDGKSFNTTNVEDVKAVGPKLAALAPNIRLIKDEFINDDIVTGEIDAGLMYTAQAVTAALDDPELKIVLPEEGLGFGIMPGFIPSNAPDKDAAYRFMEYLNEPENAAAWYSYMGYYCTNKAAEEYLDPSVKDMIIIPEDIDRNDMEMIENVPGEVNTVHEEVWAEFVSQCE